MNATRSQLYVVTCHAAGPENGFRYVGVAANPEERFKRHLNDAGYNGDGTPHGPENFSFNTLGWHWSRDAIERLALEDRLIARFDSLVGRRGYNARGGGSNGLHTPETRAKIAAALRGRRVSPETRERMSAAQRGKKASPDRIAKQSEGLKKRWQDSEYREKIAAANRGKKNTPEHIAKTAAGNRGKKRSPETRAKIAATSRARAKPVIAAGIEYASRKHAARALGVNLCTITRRLQRGKPGYRCAV